MTNKGSRANMNKYEWGVFLALAGWLFLAGLAAFHSIGMYALFFAVLGPVLLAISVHRVKERETMRSREANK